MINIALLLMIGFLKYEKPVPVDYDYCPSVDEYVSPTTWEEQGKVMRITCYTASANAHTYSGQKVHVGGCAGRKEDIGKVAYLYTIDTHELVAILEINDIGGNYQLRNQTALDVFQNSLSDCYSWIGMYGDYLFVVIKDAEG